MRKQSLYQRPIARDLSGLAAYGAKKPLALCTAGHTITGVTCTDGNAVTGTIGSCSPLGTFVGDPQCSKGSGGSSGCISGTTPG